MAKIVLAPYGSLGDLHPFLAIGLELRNRGHDVVVASLEAYREKISALGFEFCVLRPSFEPDDREAARRVMDSQNGSEILIREYILPHIDDTYNDLLRAVSGSDLFVAGEVVFVSHSVADKTGIRLVTTTLAPLSMFTTYEPNVYPNARFFQYFNFLGQPFHALVFALMNRVTKGWLKGYREFRRSVGLDPDHDPIVRDKYSDILHLAMFSRVLGKPQPDWNPRTYQTGFCFYDGRLDLGEMPEALERFLEAGDPPIVFTLGSAAVMVADQFFENSLEAAKKLQRRAVILYGVFNDPPDELDEDRQGFDYAPYGELFPRSACVVHQGGAGTTAQALKAGVPQLIVPFSHDQPDNAARCVRSGVARTIERHSYNAENAATELQKLMSVDSYKAKAIEIKSIIDSENGTAEACDAIERVLPESAA